MLGFLLRNNSKEMILKFAMRLIDSFNGSCQLAP